MTVSEPLSKNSLSKMPFSKEKDLDRPVYPQKMLDELFQHILLDDVPHLDVAVPENVMPVCTPQEVTGGYKLCWQLLTRGVNRRAFRRLVMKIALTGRTTAEERQIFKDVRARCKHMRFACANFDRRHRYPPLLQGLTVLMGNMQDAFKNHERGLTFFYGLSLWLATSLLPYYLAMRPLRAFRPDTPDGVLAYQRAQNLKLARDLAASAQATGHEFHNLRKVISRRVAFNDTLRTLRAEPELDRLSEYLATVNGMMGEMHDDLIEKCLKGQQDYKQDRCFTPPLEIVSRLEAFLKRAGISSSKAA